MLRQGTAVGSAVVFDFFGTLATGEPARRYEDLPELKWLPSVDAERVLAQVESIVEFPSDHVWPGGFEGPEEYDRALARSATRRIESLDLMLTPGASAESLARALLSCNVAPEMRLFAETRSVLEELLSLGYRLAICSNWYWNLPDLLVQLGIAHFFSAVSVSARVGAAKPSAQMYGHVIEQLGSRPSDCVFVGDSYENDVLGPRKAGMHAVKVSTDGADLARLARCIERVFAPTLNVRRHDEEEK